MWRSWVRRLISPAEIYCEPELENPPARRRERRDIGVSQFGSEADTFARNALVKVGLRPDKDVTFLQLGGHPQVAAAMAAGKLEAGVLGGLAALTAERSGARVITTAIDLNILSPSGTFAAMRGTIQRKRSVIERLMRSFVEATHYLKTNRSGSLALLQKYLGGLSVEEATYLYQEQVDLLEALPGAQRKGFASRARARTRPEG